MSTLDVENKGLVVFGLPDGGKSTLTNFILHQFGAGAFIYDTLDEFSDAPYDRYVPKNREDVTELNRVIRAAFNAGKYRLIAIDEANKHCPPKPNPLPTAINDLNDYRAHMKISTLYIARRPVQLNQDLTELASYVICLPLAGKNDILYLNDLRAGYGDMVQSLKPYHSAVYHKGSGRITVYKPVPIRYKTAKLMKPALTQ